MKVTTATINNVKYEICLGPCEAVCSNPDIKEERPSIWIMKGMKNDRASLDSLIHEILHASNWGAHEKTVERTSADLSRLLWRVGYRLIK